MSGSVSPLAALRLVYGLILRQLVTRGRLIALLLVGVVVGGLVVLFMLLRVEG